MAAESTTSKALNPDIRDIVNEARTHKLFSQLKNYIEGLLSDKNSD